ncbi:MAG TPA: organoarsenical effux MFS transporter ArsJ [Bryobacteraceae bacterium]|jgi:predicted MFS family arabinose efflux permease|nr:organoarsenical effux MFS transporter ArsJ [Bryobacteraceae bacterium]
MTAIRSYALVTGAYWGFTITDGALRMLVVLHFYSLGYDAISIAFLFLFYEFFGIVTNLLGGWIASRSGVKVTLYGGLVLQIAALLMLTFLNPAWPKLASVAFVMGAQALSGIAKDLTKMSSKSAIRVIVPDDAGGALFRWVARLTGSKNALKGAGFFVGGALLAAFGFNGSLVVMAVALAVVLFATAASLSTDLGRSKKRVNFSGLFSKSREINWLSAARLFLFAARDVWFVVGLPVFLSQLGWSSYGVGAFLALWVIGYGLIQALVPEILRAFGRNGAVDGSAARLWAFVLLFVPVALNAALSKGADPGLALIVGLAAFALIFAVNSAIHSYLVLAYTDEDSVALNVGFYYMANACGRLLGTLLSGVVFQLAGFEGCVWGSAALILIAALLSLGLPRGRAVPIEAIDAGGAE